MLQSFLSEREFVRLSVNISSMLEIVSVLENYSIFYNRHISEYKNRESKSIPFGEVEISCRNANT